MTKSGRAGMAPRVERSGQTLVVSGAVDADSAVTLRQQGEALIRASSGAVTVNLEHLETAHSVVLSVLLCWKRLAARCGISLSFYGEGGRLFSLAALSHLDDQLPGFGKADKPAAEVSVSPQV